MILKFLKYIKYYPNKLTICLFVKLDNNIGDLKTSKYMFV